MVMVRFEVNVCLRGGRYATVVISATDANAAASAAQQTYPGCDVGYVKRLG